MEKEREISEDLEKEILETENNARFQKSGFDENQNEPETEDSEAAEVAEDDDEHHHDGPDYHHFTKEQFVELIESLVKQEDYKKVDKTLKEIRPYFDEIKNQDRKEALEKFIETGGEEADFDYKYDDLTQRFEYACRNIKEQRVRHYQDLEKKKEQNLESKNAVLEKLRHLVDSEESNVSINALKEIQNEWKSIGPISGTYFKNLWANYNALIDRFYDNRSIYFELKELDRRKNLEAKIEVCEKAEKLAEQENVKEAIKELNELHEEFKHIGPVPKENQEEVWQRFKTASDAIYVKRRASVESFKNELNANAEAKKKLGDKVQEFLNFDSDRINNWNKKTKELLEIQKEWEKIGGVPREEAKEINRHFWSAFKGFFNNKNAFFKRLEEKREENLKKKETLVQEAESLKESTDWVHSSNELKTLQNEWKNIGPVPEKHRDEIYQRFKGACDYFFNRRRENLNTQDQAYHANLKQKESICKEIEAMAAAKSNDLETFENLQEQWNTIGFVPREAMKSIQEKYNSAVEKFIGSAKGIDQEDKENLKLTVHLNKLKSGPNASKKIYQKESSIRKHISQLENDIATWKNNLEFFASSRTADKLRKDFNQKIENAEEELHNLKEQLKIVSNF
ncbi:DUF349 domain-containing protein [soil metagenome]